ncbi:FAD-binding oxidoreductase [candidate division KSB1 bacterium]|nr:FAD-binding oxidoreductase [candidate division KSB1 bacterium]
MDNSFTKLIDKLKNRNIYLDKNTLSRYTTGKVAPFAVIEPDSPQIMSEVMRECYHHKTVVNIWGGGSHQNLGGQLQPYDITLSTKCLNKVIDYEPDNLTLTVESGNTLTGIQNRIKADNLFLPMNPPFSLSATVGGLAASNKFGSFAQYYGTFRDFMLGGKAVLADGQLIRFGGKTVKNVAGYDMTKLFIGSMGTIGLLTELTFKLIPFPEKILSVHLLADNPDILRSALGKIKHTAYPVLSSVLFLDLEDGTVRNPALNIDFQVREKDVKNYQTEINRIFTQDITMSENDFTEYNKRVKSYDAFFDIDDSEILYEWIVPKSQIFGLLSYLQKESEQLNRNIKVLSYPGMGILYSKLTTDEKNDVSALVTLLTARRQYVKSLRGLINIKQCPGQLKQHFDMWDMAGDQFKWHKRIKHEFDPTGIFAAGRFVGGI